MFRSSLRLYRDAYTGITPRIWWLSVVTLINRSGTMVLPFMPVYLREEMKFSYVEGGLIVACFGAGAILGAYAGGRLTDKKGFYEVQFWSLLLNGVLFILLGQMNSFASIAVCMFITSSVGEAFRPANAAAIAAYSHPDHRTRSYSLHRLAINLGWSLGPAIGGMLAAINFSYIFWFDGLTCIVAALLMRRLLPPVKPEHRTGSLQSATVLSAWKDKPYLRFMFFVFVTAICFQQMFSVLPVFYKEELHFSKWVIGLVLASNGLMIVLTEMILVYKLESKANPLVYIRLGVLLIGLSYPVLSLPAPAMTVAMLGMVMITFGEMLMFPFVNKYWISQSNEHNRGQYAAVYTIAFSLAHVLSPLLGTQIVQRAGYAYLWWTVAILCILAASGFSTVIHHSHKEITHE